MSLEREEVLRELGLIHHQLHRLSKKLPLRRRQLSELIDLYQDFFNPDTIDLLVEMIEANTTRNTDHQLIVNQIIHQSIVLRDKLINTEPFNHNLMFLWHFESDYMAEFIVGVNEGRY